MVLLAFYVKKLQITHTNWNKSTEDLRAAYQNGRKVDRREYINSQKRFISTIMRHSTYYKELECPKIILKLFTQKQMKPQH